MRFHRSAQSLWRTESTARSSLEALLPELAERANSLRFLEVCLEAWGFEERPLYRAAIPDDLLDLLD